MAHTKVTKTGTQNTGTANTFSYSGSFNVFKASEVEVELDNVKLTFTTSTINDSASPREYTVDYSAETIHIGGADLAGTNSVVIQPVTDMGAPTPRANYEPGSSVTSADLNNNQLQLMRKAMEYDEQKLSSRGGTMTGNLHLGKNIDITFEGDTDNAYETTLTVADPTADRTITFPDHTGNVVVTGKADQITATELAPNSVDSSELVNGSVDLSHMSANSVDSDQYVDGSIDHSHLSNNCIDGDNIADDSINSEHYAPASIDLEHMSANSVDSDQYVDGSIDLIHMSANSVDSDQYVDGSIDGVHIANDAIDSQHYAAGSIDNEHMSANSVDSDQYVDGSIDLIHMSANSVDSDQYVDGSIDNIHIADTTVTLGKIENVSSGQIIVGNGSNRPTAVAMSGDVAIAAGGATTIQSDSIEIGMIGCEQTSITNSDSHIPTSGAVVDYVTDALTSAGSFEVIADEDNFPATHPDPKASASVAGIAGMVISIQNAGGLQINSSGVATNARKAGSGSDDITINGFPNSMRAGVNGNATPYELTDETGLLVTTTAQTDTAYASGAVYEFHRVFVKPADYVQLSDDINDFNSKYRVGTKTANNDSSNDDGDLFFDTGANKMYVYDGAYNSGGEWKEVTSAGDFKFLTVKDHDQSSGGSGPTFNGSNEEFDLFDGSADASINSAAQLIVVLNGVVQKPNSGTFSGSEEGFYLNDTHGIKFCDPPPSGSTLFVTQIGSAVTLNEPADTSVSEAKIVDGAVSTAKIADNAVDGDKLADDITLAGTLTIPDTITHTGDTNTKIRFPAADTIALETAGSERLRVDGSGRVGIGTNNPSNLLHCATSDTTVARFESTASGGTGVELLLHHNSSSPADGDNIGAIYFQADDDAGNKSTFGTILVNAEDVSNGSEDGHIRFETASNGTVSERMRIDSSGRLLLGTTTEGHSNADDLTVASSADTGITIRSGNSSQSSLYFSDGTSGTDEYMGSVVYNHSNNQLYLATSGSNRLAIDSSGNVGIGTASPTAASSETTLNIYANEYPEVHLTSSVTGTAAGDGSIFTLNNDSSTIIRNQENSYIRFDTNGSNERMRILAGGGLTFNGDTAAANALDDYEEGTWTPTISGGIDGGAQYISQVGWYTKVGRFVHASFYLQLVDATTGSQGNGNQATLGGLPFTVLNTASYTSGGLLQYSSMSMSGSSQIFCYTQGNTTTIWLYRDRNNSASFTTGANDNKGKTMYGTISYAT